VKVYVASSWKNDIQQEVVKILRGAGHEVYDFKGKDGFHWSSVQPDYRTRPLKAPEVITMLNHHLAHAGFDRDMNALKEADAVVLVQPCGRSAHLELGWAAGADKITVVLLRDDEPPDLMYKMCDHFCTDIKQVIEVLKKEEQANNVGSKAKWTPVEYVCTECPPPRGPCWSCEPHDCED
jgi:hypothetical protein